ncbi:MAG TPA: class I SAM-dependent methyltransferase [Rhodothermales bacterium]|nr:class I SAM-dependent methyltransferase [Rhodothermales bacterium]
MGARESVEAISFHDHVLQLLRELIDRDQGDADMRLYEALRLLGKYRSQLIANTLAQKNGVQVRTGPFANMELASPISEGCHVPKLLGTYEQPLHPILASLPERQYDTVLNIGCAEGYYAVGVARLLTNTDVYAFDINPEARASCLAMAKANGVAHRVEVGAAFNVEDFGGYAGAKVLVVCDIEGEEVRLLDPTIAPALAQFDILVEVHDLFVPGCADTLRQRFAASHAITEIPFDIQNRYTFDELEELEHLDQLFALWEWRLPKNYWLWLEAHKAP